MDSRTLRDRIARMLPLLAAAAGISALILLALSVENSASFNRTRLWIVSGNAFAVLVLAWLLARKLWQLVRDFRDHVPGSRLTMRTVGIFGALVAAPLLVVYFFSLDFLNRGIDSWFQIEIRQGLNDALVLSRSALDLRRREQLQRTEVAARDIANLTGPLLLARLDQLRKSMEVAEVVVYDAAGRPLAVSTNEASPAIPTAAPRDVLLQLARGREYMSLQPVPGGQYRIVTAAAIYATVGAPRRYLLLNYAVSSELSGLADAVQDAYTNYGNLSELRQPLIISFQLALTLVLLLTMLAAIYGAIFSAQRLTRPVQDLIAGTRAVGKGDFGTRLALPSRDEMGYLVHSFNDMTKRLRRASEEAEASKLTIDSERERLAVILSRLSSGVLVVDNALRLLNANDAAGAILGWKPEDDRGRALTELSGGSALLRQFLSELQARLSAGLNEWREQLDLNAEGARRVLLWACTPLPAQHDEAGGVVIVFDDITNLLTAQRNAAWGEVARRLAHEIKNPLTPIQLSAERLRRKLRAGLSSENAQLLDRATHTIVQQVDAMQQMVNAFSEYARAPEMQLTAFALNQLVVEVADLYRLQDQQAEIRLDLDPGLGTIEADRGRLRQVLANLISNALHAISGAEHGVVEIATRVRPAGPGATAADVQLQVSDNGPGFSNDVLKHAFEPYVTSKARGTGLGLAIVKRIVEEHAGQVEADNRPQGGAVVRVMLPLRAERRTFEPRRERA